MFNKTHFFLLITLFIIVCHVNAKDNNVYTFGGITRTDPSKKQITLVFTGADMADGAPQILQTLKKHKIKAAFFLTGRFFEKFPDVISQIKKDKHYLGTHGYAHLLYSTWEDRNNMLVTEDSFRNDILKGYQQLEKVGIRHKDAPYFIPAYEHYNDTISAWAHNIGIQVVNNTSGTASAADYTTPDMKNYRSSENIYQHILQYEEQNTLKGHLLLFHIGTVDARKDKFYHKYLDLLITELQNRGYKFIGLGKAIGKR